MRSNKRDYERYNNMIASSDYKLKKKNNNNELKEKMDVQIL